jgi:hypothetical protein
MVCNDQEEKAVMDAHIGMLTSDAEAPAAAAAEGLE